MPRGGTVAILGLGPIGDMAARIAQHLASERVFGIDLVPDRLARAASHGVEVVNPSAWRPMARRPAASGRRPRPSCRMPSRRSSWSGRGSTGSALATSPSTSCGGAAPSTSRGVYGGMADPMPMMTLFDKQVKMTMGQANVRRWTDDILPSLTDEDPLGVGGFATHRLPLEEAPDAYATFQKKADGMIKAVLRS